MCAVSVTLGYMMDRVPVDGRDQQSFTKLQQGLHLLSEVDKYLEEHNCADTDKIEYLNRVREALD